MNFNNFTIKSQEAVQKAIELAQGRQQQAIETPHLLKGVMEVGENVTNFLFQKSGANPNTLNTALDKLLDSYPRVSNAEPYLSRETNAVIQKAIEYSTKEGDQFVSLEFILLALLTEKNTVSSLL
ncbi:MAG: Clp protease N-terminal domain-containing protein, partial [Bacteroidales bacterium]|nr:Clp protease N-terminal domain-containing protein [Bacteroidales bacterium]